LRLPHAALPDARGHASGAFDARNLNVCPLREAWVALEQRTDRSDLARVALNDRVRVAHRDGSELDPFDDLARPYVDRSELLLDWPVQDPRLRDPLADTDPDRVGAFALGQPPRGDPRAVSRQLCPRPVRVPDGNLGFGAEDVQNFKHAVGFVSGRKLARPLRRHPLVLDEQVEVAVR